MNNFDDYLDGFNMNDVQLPFDIQRDLEAFYTTVSVYKRRSISPTAMNNCELQQVLLSIPQPNEWEVWSKVYADAGNALEDFLADALGQGSGLDDTIKSYMSEIIPHIFEDEIMVQRVVHLAIRNLVLGFLKAQFGVGTLLSQDNSIKLPHINVNSKADLFIDVNGRFVIGEVKSIGDLPFSVHPNNPSSQQERYRAVYEKNYYQLMQLMFYTSLMACDGQLIYISRNAQKGNGTKNHPKHLNAGNVHVPFDESEALKILARIHFAKICMEKELIPPTPEHMKPPKGRKTSPKCGFCRFQGYCHKGQPLALNLGDFKHMKTQTVEPMWKACKDMAEQELTSKILLSRRTHIYNSNKALKSSMSQEQFLNMFDYKGIDV